MQQLAVKKKKIKLEPILDFIGFVGPAMILFTLFFTYPLFQGVMLSFTNWDGFGVADFIGTANYSRLFRDQAFQASIMRTFYIAGFNVFFTNILAMTFAVALTTKFKLNNLIRAVIFLPTMISMVISGFIWKFMFNEISQTMYEFFGLAFLDQSWLGNPDIVLNSIVIVSVWQGMGYVMTIYIAGLIGVDESVVEAARIDGATSWQVFFRIKLPLMLPVVTVGAFLNLTGSLRMFDTIFSLTGGGPGTASEVAMLNVYREAFVSSNFGYGSTKAVVLSLIIIVLTVIQLRLTSGKEVDH